MLTLLFGVPVAKCIDDNVEIIQLAWGGMDNFQKSLGSIC